MTDAYLNELLEEMGRLFDEENVTLYEAKTPRDTMSLLILQSRGLVRTYTTKQTEGLPAGISGELTDQGLARARELRQSGDNQ